MRGGRTDDFDYALPERLIARHPLPERDQSRLMVVHRAPGSYEGQPASAKAPAVPSHRVFSDLTRLMKPGDALVVNDSRVRAARFCGHRASGAPAEVLLVRPSPTTEESPHLERWEALVHPGSKLKAGRVIHVAEDLSIEVERVLEDGARLVALRSDGPVAAARERHGQVPLPPYLEREPEPEDVVRYQTVYANVEGSVAAPTAGLHFTQDLLEQLVAAGVLITRVRLDVGVGTFRPVTVDDPTDHVMHREWYDVPVPTAQTLARVRASGGRVWAVGTTVVRVLETAARTTAGGAIHAGSGWTDLFVRPGFDFRVVDRLITNFHLPRSTLMMLVAAFAGYETTMDSYRIAVEEAYRFYSYGDAMVIL